MKNPKRGNTASLDASFKRLARPKSHTAPGNRAPVWRRAALAKNVAIFEQSGTLRSDCALAYVADYR
jgi:hypothetical protein